MPVSFIRRSFIPRLSKSCRGASFHFRRYLGAGAGGMLARAGAAAGRKLCRVTR